MRYLGIEVDDALAIAEQTEVESEAGKSVLFLKGACRPKADD